MCGAVLRPCSHAPPPPRPPHLADPVPSAPLKKRSPEENARAVVSLYCGVALLPGGRGLTTKPLGWAKCEINRCPRPYASRLCSHSAGLCVKGVLWGCKTFF